MERALGLGSEHRSPGTQGHFLSGHLLRGHLISWASASQIAKQMGQNASISRGALHCIPPPPKGLEWISFQQNFSVFKKIYLNYFISLSI